MALVLRVMAQLHACGVGWNLSSLLRQMAIGLRTGTPRDSPSGEVAATMHLRDLKGPFHLNDAAIDREVQHLAGVFVLSRPGFVDLDYVFTGRSDIDVNNQLHVYVGDYWFFNFRVCGSEQDAFMAECDLWHDLKPLDNPAHPPRPPRSAWRCPRCELFG